MTDDLRPPYRIAFDNARDPYTARNALGILTTGSGGGGVPATRNLTAGAGLTGGGDLSADRTFDVGAGTGITVNANNVALTVPVSVANGGTGSTTAGGALTSLGAQPLDATLTVLAAFNTNGLLTQTAADTFTGRTLTGPAAGITVSNGNGVAGNPTLALADDLAALEALTGTNTIYYRSAANTWSAVNVSTGLAFSGGNLTATATAPATPTRQVFTSGSGTYTTPASCRWIEVQLVGGGGGGQAGVTSGAAGSAGGPTTFSTLTGSGGGGGTTGVGAGSTGGAATGGDVNFAGGNGGGNGGAANGVTLASGANGGASFFGGAGMGNYNAAGGAAKANTGSGGGGGGTNTSATTLGGNGGAAGGYCRKIIAAPAATYSYAVGAAGGGGTGAGAGYSGGAGAAGVIFVTEYY